ncbi:MAG: peptidoglycan-binding protein [Tindallia sp. MSAO_Bac2]|nr:MAG: peptidoglycan-binding protein [Tindallia sp. MSAO_Bac2]
MLTRKSVVSLGILTLLFFTAIATIPVSAYSEGVVLRQEMENSDVMRLQQDLKALGYFDVTPTGYFGSITESSVRNFQQGHGLTVDGLAGPATISKIRSLKNAGHTQQTVSRGGSRTEVASQTGQTNVKMMSWFDEVKPLWNRGENAVVTDVGTGLSFNVQRTYGRNHADVETLTKEDTRILKEIAGGSWSWKRIPVIVEVHGQRIAASMSPMPHAGVDGLPTNQTVNNRSGGFGTGTNLNAIHGNGMDGHIDIHFNGSRTHGSNSVCSDHQAAIKKAFNSQ